MDIAIEKRIHKLIDFFCIKILLTFVNIAMANAFVIQSDKYYVIELL